MPGKEVVSSEWDEQARKKNWKFSPIQVSAQMRFCHALARQGMPYPQIHEACLAEGWEMSYGTVVNRIRAAEKVYQHHDYEDVRAIRRALIEQLQVANQVRKATVVEAGKARQGRVISDLLNGHDANIVAQAKLTPGVWAERAEAEAPETPADEVGVDPLLSQIEQESEDANELLRMDVERMMEEAPPG